MLAEIIIYVALFSALFSCAFTAAFQTIENVHYLEVQKKAMDDVYFISSKIDYFVRSHLNWSEITSEGLIAEISGGGIPIKFVSAEVSGTATSSAQNLKIFLEIDKKVYTFSYAQEK